MVVNFLSKDSSPGNARNRTIVATSTTEAEYVAAANLFVDRVVVQINCWDSGQEHGSSSNQPHLLHLHLFINNTKHLSQHLHLHLTLFIHTTPTPIPTSTSPPPPPETEPSTDEHIYEEQSPVYYHFLPSQAQAPTNHGKCNSELCQEVKEVGTGLVTLLQQRHMLQGGNYEEEIGPNTLDAAKLSQGCLFKSRSIDKEGRYKRRKESIGKKVVSSLDFQEDNTGAEKVNAASIEVNTASKVNTGSIELNTVIEQVKKLQRKTKEQDLYKRKPSLQIAIRLVPYKRKRSCKQFTFGCSSRTRIAEEEELTASTEEKKRLKLSTEEACFGSEHQGGRTLLRKCVDFRGIQERYSKRLKEDKDDEAKVDEPHKEAYKRTKNKYSQNSKELASPEQTATGKGISNPLMAVMVCQKPYGIQLTNVSSTERVNTPGSDENRLKLYDLMYKIVKVADARVKD
ncbi:hypothetical protein Tco_1091468 [Tanacetum coccineum]|uniref:Uncharacterized protein n=1 Tax=Tanacetum coccineum TaxID=301880 RepID=A0ABQ5I7A5_9ASTR